LERSKFSPELYAGYFNHEIGKVKGFEGFRVGVSFPLWFLPQKAKTTEARINFSMAQNDYEYQKFSIQKTIENLKIQLDKLFVQISYFRENALNQADLLLKNDWVKFTNQEIKYHEYLLSVGTSFKIKLDYLESLRQYNLAAFQLEYYLN
jgi:cobalt-zinc-cadmium resistance protein CzcA